MSNPTFSICVPAYNCGERINGVLESLASQSYGGWEIIIVDDCSNKPVADYIDHGLLSRSQRVTCIRLDANSGPFIARRRAFSVARGDYIICVDSDDAFSCDSALEELYIVIKRENPDVIAFNALTSRLRPKLWMDFSILGIGRDGPFAKKNALDALALSHRFNNLCLKAIRRNCLETSLPTDCIGLRMNEDRLEVAYVLTKAETFYLLDKPLYFYHQNASSTTHALFDLDYCRQQVYVEQTILEILPLDDEQRNGLMRNFLSIWAGDMKLLSQGRDFAELRLCLARLASEPLFKEAFYLVGTSNQRVDYAVLLKMLRSGNYFFTAMLAKMRYLLMSIKDKLGAK